MSYWRAQKFSGDPVKSARRLVACAVCANRFFMWPSELKQRRAKSGGKPVTCSRKCSDTLRYLSGRTSGAASAPGIPNAPARSAGRDRPLDEQGACAGNHSRGRG